MRTTSSTRTMMVISRDLPPLETSLAEDNLANSTSAVDTRQLVLSEESEESDASLSLMTTRTAIVQDINLRRLSTDFDIPNLRLQLQYHSHSLFTCVVCCYHQIYRLNVLSLSLIRIFCSRKWCFLSVAWMGGRLLEMALLMEGIRYMTSHILFPQYT